MIRVSAWADAIRALISVLILQLVLLFSVLPIAYCNLEIRSTPTDSEQAGNFSTRLTRDRVTSKCT